MFYALQNLVTLQDDKCEHCYSYYDLFWNDRVDTSGSGLCLHLKSTIPNKCLKYCDQAGVESICVSCDFRIDETNNINYFNILLEIGILKYCFKNQILDMILSQQPNVLVIIIPRRQESNVKI